MADIQLRFGKDMLVVGSPVQAQLDRVAMCLDDVEDIAGAPLPPGSVEVPTANASFDTELSLLLEPEVFEDAFALEKAAGAQCLVAPTANLVPARLAHTGMEGAASDLARTALEVAQAPVPEHVLVEIAPCGLPLDAASKASLLENRGQYERAARLFDSLSFDAFFLNGFVRVADLKCALMGIRKVSDAPILASVDVDEDGNLCPLEPGVHPPVVCEALEEAVAVMAEFGAQVAGFCTDASSERAAKLAKRVSGTVFMPVLVQLHVREAQQTASDAPGERVLGEGMQAEGPASDGRPEDMYEAGLRLASAGVQFVRVTGAVIPSYTSMLAAAVTGLDVAHRTERAVREGERLQSEDLNGLADRLRATVNRALGVGGEGEGTKGKGGGEGQREEGVDA